MAPVREISLHDTLSGERRPLRPRDPGRVGIYACGPTVYGRIHIGNARPYVVFSLLKRFLEHEGVQATLVCNITDVNDKIYEAAPGRSAQLAADATRWYVEDTNDLGLGRPDYEPKATETMPEIVVLIEELVGRGLAYAVEGDVYFRVARFPAYGRLSRQKPDEVEEQEPNPLKEDPRDFALWKANKPGEDTWWDSPWGRGRPGWHIECSVMAEELLGPVFEIHGGGLDLVFPHHENEVAQSESATGKPFARIWMHNGLVQRDGEIGRDGRPPDTALRREEGDHLAPRRLEVAQRADLLHRGARLDLRLLGLLQPRRDHGPADQHVAAHHLLVVLRGRQHGELERLAILHTGAEPRAKEFLDAVMQKAIRSMPRDILMVNVTPVIGTHVGPNGLGFAAVRKQEISTN